MATGTTPTNPPARKLGKLPPKFNKKTLRMGKYIDKSKLPTAPPSVEWMEHVQKPYGMMKNDVAGCCTCASAGHQVMLWTALARGYQFMVPDEDVMRGYIAVTGQEGAAYNPATGENDNGCAITDVLNYWQTTGFAGHKIDGWIAFPHADFDLWRLAIWMFGGVKTGINLPKTSMDQVDSNQPWTVVSTDGDGAPGSLGGHDVPFCGYDDQGNFICYTWGDEQVASEDFLRTYCDEVYVPLSIDWMFSPDSTCPAGFDMGTLRTDLAIMGGRADILEAVSADWSGLESWAAKLLRQYGQMALPVIYALLDAVKLPPGVQAEIEGMLQNYVNRKQ
jgi:hypothetical protein